VPYLAPSEGGEGQAWAREAAAAGGRGVNRVTWAGVVVPPTEVAGLLGLDSGDEAVLRRRVVYFDDQPVEQADSFYPAAIAAGTPLADVQKIRGGAVGLLAKLGYVGATVQEDVGARRPDDEERDLFAIDATEPILTVTRLIRAKDDRPIQVDVLVTPAKYRQYRYELRIE
jgi:DNA-binding GntR family transcriptional regulator